MYADIKYKFEKLEYLREIQRLKSAISCYQESENFAGKDVSLLFTRNEIIMPSSIPCCLYSYNIVFF